MRADLSEGEGYAINGSGQSASETGADGQTDSDSSDWFGQLARPLLKGTDAGFALHIATGFLAGTCARYVTKSENTRRQPPGYFIRALLRSDQGEVWLNALMDGCDARWWRERSIVERKAALFDQAKHIISQLS